MFASMSKLTVKVPTGGSSPASTRPTVARQTAQASLNRSVPPVNDSADRIIYSSKSNLSSSPRLASTTNEFGTSRSHSLRYSQAAITGSREAAGTKIVDFGRNVELRPSGKFNVRGVGADGFFPPVKLRAGTSGVRFSTSAGSVRSKSAIQNSTALTSSPLNVELVPATRTAGFKTTASEAGSTTGHIIDDWSLGGPRPDNLAKTHTLQDKPANPYMTAHHHYNTRAALAASLETFPVGESSPSPSRKVMNPKTGVPTPAGGCTVPRSTSKDAPAWVRSYKVKQRRNNRVRELMEAKSRSPTGLTLANSTTTATRDSC